MQKQISPRLYEPLRKGLSSQDQQIMDQAMNNYANNLLIPRVKNAPSQNNSRLLPNTNDQQFNNKSPIQSNMQSGMMPSDITQQQDIQPNNLSYNLQNQQLLTEPTFQDFSQNNQFSQSSPLQSSSIGANSNQLNNPGITKNNFTPMQSRINNSRRLQKTVNQNPPLIPFDNSMMNKRTF